ncbi:MAG TPA: hypothetical protein VE053_08790 [Allosphingosinicella sp.]|nr:hypothetical protein [Allosphingosinicella sp.]
MIDAILYLGDRPELPIGEGGRVAFGKSVIDAFPSRLISMVASASDSGFEVWIGEGGAPAASRAGPPDSAVERVRGHRQGVKGDAVLVVVSGDEAQPSITIARSSAGACPIYVAANGDCLVVSWRYEAAVAVLPFAKPDVAVCRLYLSKPSGQRRKQVIEGTFILWPGEALEFSRTGLVFKEIETLPVVRAATLTTDARVAEAFLETIAESCRPVLMSAEHPLLEISGGYDSACVGLAAAGLRSDMLSYGVVHDGAVGAQQRARRAELVSLLGTRDVEYPAAAGSMFDFPLETEQHLTCMDDIYRSFSSRTLASFPYELPDLVITGIGGDELTREETFRRDPGELRGNYSSSAIAGAMTRYDVFLRRGIWVSNPLIAQDVIDFCRALPPEIRKDRLLNVLTLARAGLSDGFLFPTYAEHFGNVLLRYAVTTNFSEMFSESIVGDYGIVDVATMLQTARYAYREGFTFKHASEFLFLRKLEMVLRNYVTS